MSEAFFSLKFEGISVHDGEIDVTELAPSLLALGQAVKQAGRIMYGDNADISLKIKTMETGSFEVFLKAIQHGDVGMIWHMIKTFSQSDDGKAAQWVVEMLVGAGGVLKLLKWLKGKKPDKIENINKDEVRVTIDGMEIIVPMIALELSKDINIRMALEKTIMRPLENEGIEKIVFKVASETISVEKNEAHYFAFTTRVADENFKSTYQKQFSIVSLHFKKGKKWRLHDGTAQKTVIISDEDFIENIERGYIRFGKKDILTCEVQEISERDVSGNFKSQYEILRVIEHIPFKNPPSLF